MYDEPMNGFDDDWVNQVWANIVQSLEGCSPCIRCGMLAEPDEDLCPSCAAPAIKAEQEVRLTTIRNQAQARIKAGESPKEVAWSLFRESASWFDPSATEKEQIEQVRDQAAASQVGRELLGILPYQKE